MTQPESSPLGREGKGPCVRVLFASSELTLVADFFVIQNFVVITA